MNTQSAITKLSVAAFLTFTSLAGPVVAQDKLDDLFAELAQADENTAHMIEGQIATEWSKSGSAAMDLLLRRGEDAMAEGNHRAALEHYSAIVDHAPAFAEGYNGRATAYYLLGMTGPALDDIRTTLRLEPRHFGALRGLAVILEELERSEDALEVYRTIVDINPYADGVADAITRLEIKLEGQAI